jgi:hypothetical protein
VLTNYCQYLRLIILRSNWRFSIYAPTNGWYYKTNGSCSVQNGVKLATPAQDTYYSAFHAAEQTISYSQLDSSA